MRVAVVGGTGFIGRAVCDSLGQRDPGLRAIGSADVDLRTPGSAERLASIVQGTDAVVVLVRARPQSDGLAMVEEEVSIVTNVGRALLAARPSRAVYVSSNAVYGDRATNLSIHEDTPRAPSSHYGVGKAAAEMILREVSRAMAVPLAILRLSMVYGPGDSGAAYGPARFAKAAASREQVSLFGDGEETRDYIYVVDAVAVIAAIVSAPKAIDGAFNVASQNMSPAAIVDLLSNVCGRKLDVRHIERRQPKASQRMDTSKLRETVDRMNFTSMSDGLRYTYEYFREHAQENHG